MRRDEIMLNTKETITFLGDVYLPNSYHVNINLVNYVVNLESPITEYDIGVPGKINLKVNENHMMSTFKSKPLALCLANNHIGDYGETGLNDTIAALEREDISYFGAGSKSNNCNNPLMVKVSNISIGLLAYVCESTSPISVCEERQGVELIDIEKIKNDIHFARSNGAKKIIVSLHWGAEQVTKPRPEDMVTARKIIDQGVDLIIGHHSHCIQDYEQYKGKYIFYGLGNCIFPNFITNAMYEPETNKPQRQYEVRQKYWNKTSLAISYDLINDTVTVEVLLFDGKCLKRKPFWMPGKAIKLKRGVNYDKKFRKYFLLGKFRNAFFSWLQSPKIPRLIHLKSALSVFNAKVYK